MRKITAWIASVGLSTFMLSAQSKVAVSGTDAPVPLKAQSGHCAATRAVSDQPPAFSGAALSQTDSCSDPIDKCRNPVKYLGANDDCACFACEYGTSTQHNVCTKKQSDKDALLRRAR